MIFAPERMVHAEILALNDDVEPLTALIAAEGSVHVVRRDLPFRPGESPAESDEAGSKGLSRSEDIARLRGLADELLASLDLRPLDIDAGRRQAFLEISTDDVRARAEESLEALRDAIAGHYRQREEASTALARLDEISEQMNLLNEHGLSFRHVQEFAHLHAVCGTIERAHADRLVESLAGEPCGLAMRPVHGKTAAFLLIGDQEAKERLDAVLTNAGARVADPPKRFVRSFEEGLEQIEIELWQQRERLAELAREYEASRAQWHTELSECRARLQVHALLNEAMSRLGSDGTITLISGFVPASRRAALVRRLEREAAGRHYARFERVEKPVARDTPTHLRNWRIFRPFEVFVKTYGLPAYNDVDPTPFVAISFLAMFGMMFGDVGHGLVLAGIGAAMAFLPYRALLSMRDLGRILMMAGMSGTLFGFLFGSVFGIENDHVLPALWMRPSHPENLTAFLGVALGLGVVILNTGIVLGMVQAFRQGNVRKALMGQWSAASLAFFWALLVVVGLQITGHDLPVSTAAVALVLGIPLCLIVVGQLAPHVRAHGRRDPKEVGRKDSDSRAGHGEEEEEEEVATILFEPVEIVMNLFTNSVSFLRVAAFGLAHAALTMAVFTVNDMVRLPGVSILSLPFEHLFIVVLEGMIVTIQCLRLEYYEFFSKFFVGNGVAYAPLSIRADDSMEKDVG